MKKLIAFCIALALLSCSSDSLEPNGFNFDGKFYAVKSLIVQEYPNNETRLIFMGSNDPESGLPKTIVEINLDSPSLQETTLQIASDGLYRFQAKPFFDEDVFTYETTILDSSMPDTYLIESGTVNITTMDSHAIELSVNITRTDGETITGHYLGIYN
jgi:hypothetical protein